MSAASRKHGTRTGRPVPTGPGVVNHFRPHPWHGLEVGPEPPEVLNAYIEITPFDLMKYEVDKVSGYLRVDRPQRSSAQQPTFLRIRPADLLRRARPRAGARLEARRRRSAGHLRAQRARDHPERDHRPRPGHRGAADDRRRRSRRQDHRRAGERLRLGRGSRHQRRPAVFVERLQHYFLTYKFVPGRRAQARIAKVYGRKHALKVVLAAMADYDDHFALESGPELPG